MPRTAYATAMLLAFSSLASLAGRPGIPLSQRVRTGETYEFRVSRTGSTQIGAHSETATRSWNHRATVVSHDLGKQPPAFEMAVETHTCSTKTVRPPAQPPVTTYTDRETASVRKFPPETWIEYPAFSSSGSPYIFTSVITWPQGRPELDWFGAVMSWSGDTTGIDGRNRAIRHSGSAGGRAYYYGFTEFNDIQNGKEEFLWVDTLGLVRWSTGIFFSGSGGWEGRYELVSRNGKPLDSLLLAISLSIKAAYPGSPAFSPSPSGISSCVDPGVSIRPRKVVGKDAGAPAGSGFVDARGRRLAAPARPTYPSRRVSWSTRAGRSGE